MKANSMTINDLPEIEKRKQEALAIFGTGKLSPEMIGIGKEALRLSNLFRKDHHKPELVWNQSLAEIGQVHSLNMAEGKVSFSHTGFSDRAKQFPFVSVRAAENIAWCEHSLSDSADVVVKGWIHSPGHRKNLLADHLYCGIGVYRNSRGRVYFTQLFAFPF